jgi:tetratricopeptide (TPR) repeat protein
MDADRTAFLNQRRKQQIVEIVSDLLRAAMVHREIQEFHQEGTLRFNHIEALIDDGGHSILYRLKGNCHALFRHNNDRSCHDEERLLDLAVGSIFHEAMKLRENLYQVEMYRPRYLGIQLKKTPYRASLLDRFEKIILRAEEGIQEGVADIRALFGDTLDQLIDLMRGYGDNDLLVRFLLTHRKLFLKVYGRKQLENLFISMFKNGLIQAHWIGAMSYLQSGYYDMASQLLAKATRLTPDDEKLRFLYLYARGLDAYYNNNYKMTLRFFGKLPRLNEKFKGKRTYLNQAIGICREISMESLAEQNRRMVRRANKMASQLKNSNG